jgi:hypothetical protein
MRNLMTSGRVLASLLLAASVAAGCASHGRAERAGRKVDQGVDKVDRGADRAADKVEYGADRAADKVDRAVDELKN